MKEGWTSLHKTIREINLVFKGSIKHHVLMLRIASTALEKACKHLINQVNTVSKLSFMCNQQCNTRFLPITETHEMLRSHYKYRDNIACTKW